MVAVNPPRSVFLDFPLGHTAGPADTPVLQRNILNEAFKAFASMTKPGSIKDLSFKWTENPNWKDSVFLDHDTMAGKRYNSPQFQNEEDHLRWKKKDLSALNCVCDLCQSD